MDDVLNLLRVSKRIIVLSGAGISVSCGIRESLERRHFCLFSDEHPAADFRSSSGIYALLNEEMNYELDDPQQM